MGVRRKNRMSGPIRPLEEITGPGLPEEEEVLAVPRADLVRAGVLEHGFRPEGWERCLALVAERGTFLRRGAAEEDDTHKQIIPYAVVTFQDRVFLLRRTSRGGEARLHGKFSIGVGGHVNPERVPRERLVEAGLQRELAEELVFERPFTCQPIGLINDDRVPVGRVHLGIVYRVLAGDAGVRVREEDLLLGRFARQEEVRQVLPFMESWSRLLAEALFFQGAPPGRL